MYRSQTDNAQARRETSNKAQLALIKVFLLYIVQTGSHEKVKLEPDLGTSIHSFDADIGTQNRESTRIRREQTDAHHALHSTHNLCASNPTLKMNLSGTS